MFSLAICYRILFEKNIAGRNCTLMLFNPTLLFLWAL